MRRRSHNTDSTVDRPSEPETDGRQTGGNDSRTERRRDGSHRDFLRTSVAAGASALALGTSGIAAGQSVVEETCESFGEIPVGDEFLLVNNDWGTRDQGAEDDSSADPNAELDPSTTSASVGERITFGVTDTTGHDPWLDSLEWDFGDGTTASGWWNAHTDESAGTYTVALMRTDNEGTTSTHEVTITVSETTRAGATTGQTFWRTEPEPAHGASVAVFDPTRRGYIMRKF